MDLLEQFGGICDRRRRAALWPRAAAARKPATTRLARTSISLLTTVFCSLCDRPTLPRLTIDQLLLIDGPRYDGSTIIASLQAGLLYPNPNQDFDITTTRRQDRDS